MQLGGWHRLREAAYVDDAVELIKCRQPGCQRPLKVTADIVLDDNEVAALGHLEHAVSYMWRHRRAGRILHRCLRKIDLRLVPRG